LEKEHPIGGVIKLLEELQTKAKAEGEEETSTYQKYTYWCSSVQKDLTKEIDRHAQLIDSLESTVDAEKKDVLTLERNIAKLDKQLTRFESQAAKALENRQEDEAWYTEEQSDLTDTIDTMDTLITALDVLQGDKDSANALLLSKKAARKAAKLLEIVSTDAKQRETLRKFVDHVKAAPKTKAVDGSDLGSVMDLVKAMKADFEKKRTESTKEETEAKNNYNLAKQARDYAISEAEGSKTEKEVILGDRGQDLANHEAELSDEEALHSSETENRENNKAECDAKAAEWDERSGLRAGELEAMKMAVSILTKVSGVRNPDTHEIPAHAPYGLNQEEVSFLQTDDPKAKAVNLLKQVAAKRHSKLLAKLADQIGHMAMTKGPFDEIKQMVQKMVFRLMAEQKDEDDHKMWCDSELTKSTDSKTDKDNRMELLNSKLDTAQANVADLTQQISENANAISTLDTYMQEETRMREESKAENTATIKDSQDAQRAIDEASAVLTTFYKESGMIAKKPYEFVQKSKSGRRDIDLPESPSTWDSGYTGVNDPSEEGSGVLAILTATNEKYATLEADSKATEESDEKNYKTDMMASEADKAEKQRDSDMKGRRKNSMMQKASALTQQKKHLAYELNAVEQYLTDLEPACVQGDSSYADRKAARADEVAALKKALGILEDAFSGGFLQRRNIEKH